MRRTGEPRFAIRPESMPKKLRGCAGAVAVAVAVALKPRGSGRGHDKQSTTGARLEREGAMQLERAPIRSDEVRRSRWGWTVSRCCSTALERSKTNEAVS